MRCAVVVMMLAVAAPAGAQESSIEVPITLEEALAQGTATSARLAELDARREGAEFSIAARVAADRPNLTAQGGYTRTNHVDPFGIPGPNGIAHIVYPDIPDNYRSRLDLQWPIYTGGRSDALERAARAEAGATVEDLAAARADLRLEITRAFWALITADEAVAVVRRSLDAIGAQVLDLREKFRQGLLPPNDVSSAEAEQARQRMLLVDAESQRTVADADLRRLTGNERVGRLTPVLPVEAAPMENAPSATLIAAAIQARPERRAIQFRIGAAEEQVTAANAAGHPQLFVASGFDYANPNARIFPRQDAWKTSWDASVNVSWSLWDAGRRAADRGLAISNVSALKARADDLDRNITFEVRQRAAELESSRSAIAAADEEIRAAAEAERVVTERYRAGVATPTDVLDAQVARLRADLDRTRAVASSRLAEARLARATGRP